MRRAPVFVARLSVLGETVSTTSLAVLMPPLLAIQSSLAHHTTLSPDVCSPGANIQPHACCFAAGCSVAYMGFVMNTRFSRPAHINDREHTLRRLFVLEPDALEDMLATLADNKTWHGLVKMPAHLDLTEPVTPAATSFSGATAEAGQLEAGTPRNPSRFGPRSNPSSTRSTREDMGQGANGSSSARSTREEAPGAVCGLGGGSIPASVRSTAEDFATLCSISEHGGSSPTAAGGSGDLGKSLTSSAGSSSVGSGPKSWPGSGRSTRQSVSTGGAAPQAAQKQRRTSWHLPGKPFLEACQNFVLGNRAGSVGGGPSSPGGLRAKQANAGRSSRVVQVGWWAGVGPGSCPGVLCAMSGLGGPLHLAFSQIMHVLKL
jgi:hypothetical protein